MPQTGQLLQDDKKNTRDSVSGMSPVSYRVPSKQHEQRDTNRRIVGPIVVRPGGWRELCMGYGFRCRLLPGP